jgi:hypothetical protein
MVHRYRSVRLFSPVLAISAALVLAQATSAAERAVQNAALKYWTAFGLMTDVVDKEKDAVDRTLKLRGPVDSQLVEVLRGNEAALRELRRGAAMVDCEWGQSIEDGVNMPLPHLWRARTLAKLACLDAQWNFQQAKPHEAIDDLIAAMTLARHSAKPLVLISLLVDYAIEAQVIDVAAGHLKTLGPADLKRLSERIEKLPAAGTVGESMLGEKDVYLEWFIRTLSQPGGKDVVLRMHSHIQDGTMKAVEALPEDQLRQGAIELRPVYDRLAELAKRPLAEVEKSAKNLLPDANLHGPARVLGELLLPAVQAGRQAEDQHLTRLALLKAAIAVCLDGQPALSAPAHKDPVTGLPFQYEKTPDGFRLQSKTLAPDGKPIALNIGSAAGK